MQSFLFVSADHALHLQLKEAVGDGAHVELIAADAQTASQSRVINSAPPETLLVVDAQLPGLPNAPPDRKERASLDLLRKLRAANVSRPALVITSRPLGVTDLDIYCSPENRAIALPRERLEPSIVAGFLRMLQRLQRPSATVDPVWEVIELQVERTSVKCFLGERNGNLTEWLEASTSYFSAVQSLAIEWSTPDFREGWVRRIHDDGQLLFRELVIATLGPGLFSHLELSAGGLENLAFRFRLENPALYAAPYEATVRLSGQELSGTPEDYTLNPFLVVNAPITRKMVRGTVIRSMRVREEVAKPAKMLFIRSQLGEHPDGATEFDTLAIPELDRSGGGTRFIQKQFRKLGNIDNECQFLMQLETQRTGELLVTQVDLSRDAITGAEDAVVKALMAERFDIVHYAGHSLTTKDGLTILVLPGRQPGQAAGMAVERFAAGVADSGARLLYLSSCRGSSANTVASLSQRGVPHVLGFRWDVDDARAAEFSGLFYKQLLGRPGSTICQAFRSACRGVYEPMKIEESPIWASPILASGTDDWLVHRVL